MASRLTFHCTFTTHTLTLLIAVAFRGLFLVCRETGCTPLGWVAGSYEMLGGVSRLITFHVWELRENSHYFHTLIGITARFQKKFPSGQPAVDKDGQTGFAPSQPGVSEDEQQQFSNAASASCTAKSVVFQHCNSHVYELILLKGQQPLGSERMWLSSGEGRLGGHRLHTACILSGRSLCQCYLFPPSTQQLKPFLSWLLLLLLMTL